jgi:hypothetical protein
VPTMSRPTETERELLRAAENGDALSLTGRADNVVRAVFVRDLLRSADFHPRGLMIYGARITGWLDLDFMTTVPLTLANCVLDDVSMCDAQIPAVDFSHSAMSELRANRLRTRGFQFVFGRCGTLFDLAQAEIDGDVRLHKASIETLRAPRLRVSGNLIASDLYVHTSYHEGDACRLDACDIGGNLNLSHALITSHRGHAVIANGARVGGTVTARNAILRGEGLALSLIGADTGGLDMTGAVLRSRIGTALSADSGHFRGDVMLHKINAVTQRAGATIRMDGTSIKGTLIISGLVRNRGGQAVTVYKSAIGANLVVQDIDANSRKAALSISNTDIGDGLALWPDQLRNRGDGATLDLSDTRIGQQLVLDATKLIGTVSLNGLVYPKAPENTDAWLAILRDHTAKYEAQPYQQLAAVHRAAGHEHTARKVLIAQQRDLRRRGDPGNKLLHRFVGATLGYGYRPSRAVAGLLITFLLAISLVWTAGEFGGLTPAKDRPADSCSPVNRISLAADLAIPLVKLGGTPRCELANGPAGQWATGAGWIVQILGWSFATLSVAGFTGLVRKG